MFIFFKPLLIGVQNRKDILDSFKKPNARHIKFHNTIFYAHCRFIQHGKLGARRKFIAIELFVLQFSFMFFPYLCKFTNQGDFPNAQFLRMLSALMPLQFGWVPTNPFNAPCWITTISCSLHYSVSTSNTELHRLLLDCNETEQEIIIRMAKELKAILVSLGI